MVYAVAAMTVLIGGASLAVDYGRYVVAKSELQAAADSAARYAAAGLANNLNGTNAAAANAVASALQNKVDGDPIACVAAEDVEIGIWKENKRQFKVKNSGQNAVHVTLRRTRTRGNPIQLGFAGIFGFRTIDIEASAVAYIDFGANRSDYDYRVPATSNLWLAGMPNGTVSNPGNPHNNPDYAPSASPVYADGMPVNPGQSISFDSVNGSAKNDVNNKDLYTADGNAGWNVNMFAGSEHGKSDIKAPINCIIAVFLSDNNPASEGAPPATLDFTSTSKRDFLSLSPLLRQTFFVGDGRRDGGEVQRFVVPPGATRMFIGTMDGYEWNNNAGEFNVTAHVAGRITLVD